MPNPRSKHSRARSGRRRAHDALATKSLSECPQCHQPKLPHHVCLHCGAYKGRTVIAEKEQKA
jgi:large subunit ribosomal protein L32